MSKSTAAYTVRVEQSMNGALKIFLAESAADLSVSRVTTQEVTVALYEELLADRDLRARVLDRIAGR